MLDVFSDPQQRRNILLFASLFTVFLLTFYLFLYSAIEPEALLLETVLKRYLK